MIGNDIHRYPRLFTYLSISPDNLSRPWHKILITWHDRNGYLRFLSIPVGLFTGKQANQCDGRKWSTESVQVSPQRYNEGKIFFRTFSLILLRCERRVLFELDDVERNASHISTSWKTRHEQSLHSRKSLSLPLLSLSVHFFVLISRWGTILHWSRTILSSWALWHQQLSSHILIRRLIAFHWLATHTTRGVSFLY